jgi:parallel beta-helix repeat protein
MVYRSLPIRAALAAIVSLILSSTAGAFPQTLNAWQERYGETSASGDNAACQLCHVETNGGSPWNGYGWDIRDALADPGCDLNANGVVSNAEAFFCVELDNSDGDGSGVDNITEIGLSTQPGWTEGPFNTHYSRSGTTEGNLPPDGIGPIDPDGTEPPPPEPPLPPDDTADLPPGQLVRNTIVVRPGDSIQTAIDRAKPGTRIYILAGTYKEVQNPTNGLTITKNGLTIIGQKTKKKRVVIENAGSQRNGIVVVPEDRSDCMGCHTDLAPPFPVHPGTPMGLKMRDPMMHGIEIRSITIKGFRNNGLFTENVDGFKIIDVESIDNLNYGIFPTLSKNGLISHSKAIGSSLDSGIWVETSENVTVQHSFVSGNVNGLEVSNSDDILLAHNEATGNTVGAAILLLPDIFDDRPGAKRIDLRNNWIHNNNKENTARPGSILSFVPASRRPTTASPCSARRSTASPAPIRPSRRSSLPTRQQRKMSLSTTCWSITARTLIRCIPSLSPRRTSPCCRSSPAIATRAMYSQHSSRLSASCRPAHEALSRYRAIGATFGWPFFCCWRFTVLKHQRRASIGGTGRYASTFLLLRPIGSRSTARNERGTSVSKSRFSPVIACASIDPIAGASLKP